MFPKIPITGTAAWKQLQKHHQSSKDTIIMKAVFKEQPDRFQKFSLTLGDILFDYSKNRVTNETMNLLQQLAEQTKVKDAIEAMFTGEIINETEGRPVLHTALRNYSNEPVNVNGKVVMSDVSILQEY